MTVDELQQALEAHAQAHRHDGSTTVLRYRDTDLVMMSDASADRMRLMAMVDSLHGKDGDDLFTLLEANFHSALDARYAINNGRIYAIYLHPLSTLQHEQVAQALDQVVNLRFTFGSSYSSTGLTFSPGE